jgi:hypothetical protein
VVTRRLARRTRSKLYAPKRNDSWMIGVGHDGIILFGSYAALKCSISLAGLGWWMIYRYIM